MKVFIITIMLAAFSFGSSAQENPADTLEVTDSTLYRVLTSQKSEYLGYILKQDAREVLLRTDDGRSIFIPQYVISKIEKVDATDFNAIGKYIGEDKFATRYFLTTNGLPIKKGEHYVQWSLLGPDIQFAVGDNFGMGIMTSWIGMPIIANAKYSFQLGEKTQFAVGGLLGTGGWAAWDWGGALPFGTISYGSRRANIALSAGYGAIWAGGDAEGRAITSVAGMVKVGPNISLVFDSFILLPGETETITNTYEYTDWQTGETYTETYSYDREKPGIAIFVPGIRWHQDEGKALQFGLTGVAVQGDLFPVPIPMVQWFRSI